MVVVISLFYSITGQEPPPKSNCQREKKGIWSQFWSKLFHTSKFCNISPSIDWIQNSHFSQTPWLNKLQNLPPSPHTPSLNLWLIHYFCIEQHRKANPGYSTHKHTYAIFPNSSLFWEFLIITVRPIWIRGNWEEGKRITMANWGGREPNDGRTRFSTIVPFQLRAMKYFLNQVLCHMNWQRR